MDGVASQVRALSDRNRAAFGALDGAMVGRNGQLRMHDTC